MYKLKPHDSIETDVPQLKPDDLKTSYFEFWPAWLFYLPMKFYGGYLSLRYGPTTPTISNPLFDAGGFAGESKSQILDQAPNSSQKWFAKHKKYVTTGNIDHDILNIEKIVNDINISYPYVIKPDIGCRGIGVQLMENKDELQNYLKNFPVGEAVQIQELHDYPYEAGVFYIRYPHEEKGRIFSMTLKYFPRLIGDGTSTIRELIENDPRAKTISHVYMDRHAMRLNDVLEKDEVMRLVFTGSHSRGTIFKNGNDYITQAMTDKIDEISKTIPEFYFGRYDIRFHRFSDLEKGENMKIIEINGATGEATHIWDSNGTLMGAYKTLIEQYRSMFQIGHANKKRGFKPLSFKEVWSRIKKDETRFEKYPITH